MATWTRKQVLDAAAELDRVPAVGLDRGALRVAETMLKELAPPPPVWKVGDLLRLNSGDYVITHDKTPTGEYRCVCLGSGLICYWNASRLEDAVRLELREVPG